MRQNNNNFDPIAIALAIGRSNAFDLEQVGVVVIPKREAPKVEERLSPLRIGAITASESDKLMTCESKSPKNWSEPARIISFGATSEKYILGKAFERLMNIQPNFGSTASTRWGVDNEDTVLRKAEIWAKKRGWKFKKIGFVKIKDRKAGATPDQGIYDKDDKLILGVEAKCVDSSYDGLVARLKYGLNCKDYMQMQFQMLAMGVDKVLYPIAFPVADIKSSEAKIETISLMITRASETIQKALKIRIEIADKAIDLWIERTKELGLKPDENGIINLTGIEIENDKIIYRGDKSFPDIKEILFEVCKDYQIIDDNKSKSNVNEIDDCPI